MKCAIVTICKYNSVELITFTFICYYGKPQDLTSFLPEGS